MVPDFIYLLLFRCWFCVCVCFFTEPPKGLTFGLCLYILCVYPYGWPTLSAFYVTDMTRGRFELVNKHGEKNKKLNKSGVLLVFGMCVCTNGGCVTSREHFRHVWGRTGCDHDPEMPNGPWNYHRVTREKMMKLAIFSQVSLAAAHAHSSEDTLEAMTASVAITTGRVHPQALACRLNYLFGCLI